MVKKIFPLICFAISACGNNSSRSSYTDSTANSASIDSTVTNPPATGMGPNTSNGTMADTFNNLKGSDTSDRVMKSSKNDVDSMSRPH